MEAFGFELERQFEPLAAHAPCFEPGGEPFDRAAGDEQERFQVVDRPLEGLRLAEGGRRRTGSERRRIDAPGGGMERRSAPAETAVDLASRQAGQIADGAQAPELQRVEDLLVVAVRRRAAGTAAAAFEQGVERQRRQEPGFAAWRHDVRRPRQGGRGPRRELAAGDADPPGQAGGIHVPHHRLAEAVLVIDRDVEVDHALTAVLDPGREGAGDLEQHLLRGVFALRVADTVD